MVLGNERVASLIKETRDLVDQVVGPNTQPANDDDTIKAMLQSSCNKLFYELVDTDEDYYTKDVEFTIENGQRINLPSDFYKIASVGRKIGEDRYDPINKITIKEINIGTGGSFYDYFPDRRIGELRYLLVGSFTLDQIIVIPERRNSGTYKIWYDPEVVSIEKMKLPKGYEDYLKYDAAIDAAGSDFSETMEWKAKRNDLKRMIDKWAQNRESQGPKKVQRVQTDEMTVEDMENLSYYG